MSKASPTPILIDTKILSQIISDVLETVDAPATKKSACLNKAAARIAGPKHNWGFLTGQNRPVHANGVAPEFSVHQDTQDHDLKTLNPISAEEISSLGTEDPLPLPTMESWNKVTQIMEDLAPLTGPLSNAVKKCQDDLLDAPAADPLPVDVNDLLDFMEKQPDMSQHVIEYMRNNAKSVQDNICAHSISPRSWENIATFASKIDEELNCGDPDTAQKYIYLLKNYAHIILGPQSSHLIRYLKL